VFPVEDILTTSIEIDEKLFGKAREILGTGAIKDTIEKSLRLVVRQRALRKSSIFLEPSNWI